MIGPDGKGAMPRDRDEAGNCFDEEMYYHFKQNPHPKWEKKDLNSRYPLFLKILVVVLVLVGAGIVIGTIFLLVLDSLVDFRVIEGIRL
jgi:hypothetical protein